MSNTKEHILNISLNLFLQKSFKEVTMKEIVEKTGISKGAFYHYFDSKEQLFLQIIDRAFPSVIGVYYNKLSKESLYQFYHDYATYFIESIFSQNKGENGNNISFNYFCLIFDALKIFPDFQQKVFDSQQTELNIWKGIIQAAKDKGEIKSLMKDEQIARMFMYLSDGVAINIILTKLSCDVAGKSLLDIWDSFYQELKR